MSKLAFFQRNLLYGLLAVALGACNSTGHTESVTSCDNGDRQCVNDKVERCENEVWQVWDDCPSQQKICAMVQGEATCVTENDTDSETNTDTGPDADADGDSDGDGDNDTDADGDSDGDADGDNDIDTDDLNVHWGCTEKNGEFCLDIADKSSCSAETYCQWGVAQCLPNGFGCRDQKTKEGCENLDYCIFETWDVQEPCLYRCEIHWDEDSCNQADGCEWSGRYCTPKKLLECREQTDEASCNKVADCDYLSSCTIVGYCSAITKEGDCNSQDGCTWKDNACLFDCQIEYATEEDCEAANNELECLWNSFQMICMNVLPVQDFRTCRRLQGDECRQNEKCRVIQQCDIASQCREYDEDECVKEEHENYCTAGICEHACTPKNSKQGCESIDGCMWIPVYYEPGQECITACH